MPRNRKRRNQKTGRSRGRTSGVDATIVRYNRDSSGADTHFVSGDLSYKAARMSLSQSPPKNLRQQITWFQFTNMGSAISMSSTNVETNFVFMLSDVPGYTNIQALFDEYCIYAVSITFSCTIDAVGSSVVTTSHFGRLTTAIDFNSNASAGSEAAVQAYASANTFEIGIDKSVQRFIKPCVLSDVHLSGTGATPAAATRSWISTTSPTITHYCIRTYATYVDTPVLFDVIKTYVIGARMTL